MDASREAGAQLSSQWAPSGDSCPGQVPTPLLHTRFAPCPRCLLSPLTQNLLWKKKIQPQKCIPLPREAGAGSELLTSPEEILERSPWDSARARSPHPVLLSAGPQECFATHRYK